jgi:hypothetical protein
VDVNGESLDLTVIARTLRRARNAFVLTAVVGAIAGGTGAALLGKYESEGVYTLGAIAPIEVVSQARPNQQQALQALRYEFTRGIGLQDFKTTYPKLDSENFRRFVERRQLKSTSVDRMLKLITVPRSRAEMLVPVYGATRADLRELGEQSKPVENLALAIQISYAASDPLDATKGAQLLGDFVGESLFGSQAASLVMKRLEQHESRAVAVDNRLISNRFAIETTGDKIKLLQTLRTEFPDVANSAARQVVSVADGGARYLSPNAQLVGLESWMADLREEIATNERTRNVSRLLAAYYRKAGELANGNPLSQDLLAALAKAIDTSFTSGGTDMELAEARNEATLDFYALRALRDQGFRFAAGPTGGWRDGSRIWKWALASAVAAVLLVALVVLIAAAVRDGAAPRAVSSGA